MPPRRAEKETAHDELARLEGRVADAVGALREAEAKAAAANVALEAATEAVTEAHDVGQDPAAAVAELDAARRGAEEAAFAVEGLARRVQRAEGDVKTFKAESGVRLLEERAPRARELAGEVTRLAHELLRASKAMDAERAHVDKLLASIPGLSPAHDGPPGEHAWAPAIRELKRAVATSELEPLVPRLGGLRLREREDQVARRLKEEREGRVIISG